MQNRWLVALVAAVASSLVLVNLSGAFKIQLPSYESSIGITDQPPNNSNVNLASSPYPENWTFMPLRRKLVLIHVGKTGGETVRHTLKITCRMRKNPEQQRLCWDSFSNRTESALSRHTIGTLHCDLLLPRGSLDRATTLLWTLRNPLDRVVSWFQYMNPANCRPLDDYHSTACNTNRSIANSQQKGSKWAMRFFGCFPTINHFANVLVTTEDTSSSNCSRIAWRTISGQASASSGHIYFNHQYYWKETIEKHAAKEIWVLRTESLWDDMTWVEELLSPKDHHQKVIADHFAEKRNVTHGSEGHVRRDELSVEGQERLCCALRFEMAIYGNLIRDATNLEEEAKRKSLMYVSDQCGEDFVVDSSADRSSTQSCVR